MDKKKRNILLAVLVLAVLAAAIAVLAILNRPGELPESGSVAVRRGDEVLRTYTTAELKTLPAVEVEKEIVSSSFANDEGLFRGVALRTLLADAGVDVDALTQVVVRSEDGFVAAYPADEVAESDNIFLAYSKNGEPLGDRGSGGSGPLRIVVTEDEFGNRCAKYVSEIEVK